MIKFYANIIIFVLTFTFSANGQKYPQNIFRSPLDMNHYYSGTFGELRPNHFHSGVDFATLGKQGLPVYAAAPGWVSRIKVSAYGYGYAVYVLHPNGYTTVYGHLKSYNQRIADYVRKRQYELESFDVDIFPDSTELPVSANEIIAYSGNTGGSAGPHLHFEVRDSKTEETINPLLFGLAADDTIAPAIDRIKVYPDDIYSFIDHKNEAKILRTQKNGKNFLIKSNDTLDVFGNIYFGIETWDRLNKTTNHNGIYLLKVYVDDSLFYLHRLDKFNFKDTRFINDHIDYEEYVKTGARFQTTRISEGNKLCIYQYSKNNGVLNFSTDRFYHICIQSCDYNGNCSDLKFVVRGSSTSLDRIVKLAPNPLVVDTLYCNSSNTFLRKGIRLNIPSNALLDNLYFEYFSSWTPSGCYSKLHHLHNIYTPIADYINLSITPDDLPAAYQEKAIIVKVESNGRLSSVGGEWNNGVVSAKIKAFGDYAISVDTISPRIVPLNISDGKKIYSKQKTIDVKISDNLSGISKYKAMLNGEFLLMSLDGKTGTLSCEINNKFTLGKNVFELRVIDYKNNETLYKSDLIKMQ